MKKEPTTLIEGVALACVFAATPLILAIIWTEEPEYIWQLLFSDILIFAICVLCSDPEEKKIPEPIEAKRVRFSPRDTAETYIGTVIFESEFYYLVIPDDNLKGTASWNKKRCDVLHKKK